MGGGGFAFLRESHAGYKAPPALCQEPAFESTTTKKQIPFGICFIWWEVVDSNHRSHRRQIYSLFPLATRETSHMQLRFEIWSW